MVPTDIHERCPIIMGCERDVSRVSDTAGCHAEALCTVTMMRLSLLSIMLFLLPCTQSCTNNICLMMLLQVTSLYE